MLPELENPRILDAGCGYGDVTVYLAKLSKGEIIGVDIDQHALNESLIKIKKAGLSDRLHVVNRSLFELNFKNESFDIIWTEASIHNMGFATGLKTMRRFIKPQNYLIVHDITLHDPDVPQEIVDLKKIFFTKIKTTAEYIKDIPLSGYDIIDHFLLPEDFWWIDYYVPLQKRILKLREQYTDSRQVQKILDNEQSEVDLFRKYIKWYGSVYFIMQKSEFNKF